MRCTVPDTLNLASSALQRFQCPCRDHSLHPRRSGPADRVSCHQDVDEFFWTPSHRRLVDFLAAQPDDVSEIIGLVGPLATARLLSEALPPVPSPD